jgi:hypothetical protein
MINQRHSHGQTSSPPQSLSRSFPSVADLEAAPSLLLTPPFLPAWCRDAKLFSKGSEEGFILKPIDLPLAVSLTLKCGDAFPVVLGYWDFVYLAALSQFEGHVRPNAAKKGGKSYIRFKAASLNKVSMQFPVGRLILDLGRHQNVRHRDDNRRNLLRSNLETVGGFAKRNARIDLERYQINRAGQRGEALAKDLAAITEHHAWLLASLSLPQPPTANENPLVA